MSGTHGGSGTGSPQAQPPSNDSSVIMTNKIRHILTDWVHLPPGTEEDPGAPSYCRYTEATIPSDPFKGRAFLQAGLAMDLRRWKNVDDKAIAHIMSSTFNQYLENELVELAVASAVGSRGMHALVASLVDFTELCDMIVLELSHRFPLPPSNPPQDGMPPSVINAEFLEKFIKASSEQQEFMAASVAKVLNHKASDPAAQLLARQLAENHAEEKLPYHDSHQPAFIVPSASRVVRQTFGVYRLHKEPSAKLPVDMLAVGTALAHVYRQGSALLELLALDDPLKKTADVKAIVVKLQDQINNIPLKHRPSIPEATVMNTMVRILMKSAASPTQDAPVELVQTFAEYSLFGVNQLQGKVPALLRRLAVARSVPQIFTPENELAWNEGKLQLTAEEGFFAAGVL